MNTSKQKTDQKRAVRRRIMQVFITFVLQFALLFIPAWKLNWPMAWALMGAYLLILLYNGLIVFKGNPELIAERGQPKEGVKPWDKTITTITMSFTLFLSFSDSSYSAGLCLLTSISRLWYASRKSVDIK
jgi:hypothetical protein